MSSVGPKTYEDGASEFGGATWEESGPGYWYVRTKLRRSQQSELTRTGREEREKPAVCDVVEA